jgi:hypothetical protein
MPTKADPDMDRAIGRLASTAPPHAGTFRLKGDEHYTRVDGTDSPTWDFAGPVELDRCGSRVILIVPPGNRAPAQEGPFRSPPMGVLPIRVWSRMSLTWFLLLLSLLLNSKGFFLAAGVVPRQL